MTWRRRFASPAAAYTVAALLIGSSANAQYRHRVVLLEQTQSSEADREVITRLRAELGVAGFEVIVLPVDAEQDPKLAVESAGRELHPASVLLMERQEAGSARANDDLGVELWIADRMLRKTFVLRLKTASHDRSQEAARIAVQALELVKARFAELAVTRERQRVAAPALTSAQPQPLPQARGAKPNLAAEVGLLHGFQRGQQALTPVLRLGVALPERWTGEILAIDVRGSFVGLGQAARVTHGPGSASLRHTVAGADALMRFLPKGQLQPFVSLGGGLLALDVTGEAPAPYRTASQRTLSGLLTAGGGAWLQPLPGLGLVIEAQLMEAWSKTIVRIASEDAGEVAAPLLLLSAGLMVGF